MPAPDHRVALDSQQELLAPARERLRHGQVVLDVLFGEQRRAGRDLAEERKPVLLLALARDQLERPRLGRIALEQPRPLEVGEMGVHRGGRGEPDCLPDLAHGRRVTVLFDVGEKVVPDLSLSRR